MAADEGAGVSYTVKEMLARLESKIDTMNARLDMRHERLEARVTVLERVPHPMASGELRMAQAEQALVAHGTRLTTLEDERSERAGGAMSRARMFGIVVGTGSVIGAVGGLTVALINAL